MSEILLIILNDYLIPAIFTFLAGFVTWICSKIKSKYEEKVKSEFIQNIVEKVVEYVEQKYENIDSGEKYNKALERAKEWLAQKNIEVSEIELDSLIESSVYKLTNSLKTKEK